MHRPRIVVVGGGFAGVECARRLERRLDRTEARIDLITPFDYSLYLPLLPHVAAGILTPQSVAVSLRRILRRTVIVPGGAIGVDAEAKECVVRTEGGETVTVGYDYLVLAPGSVTRTMDIPGLEEHARGMKTLAEAVYLRDHVIKQLDLAAASPDPDEQASRLGFVVVGGGYAGTETAASLQRLTSAACRRFPDLDPGLVKWHLLDIAPKLMPELGEELGNKALHTLRRRGIDISLGVSVSEARADSVTLTDGRVLPCRTLIWTAGVAACPLMATLGTDTVKGRLTVTESLEVPGLDGVFAVGDSAAVPDLTRGEGEICAPTAQHAHRQGRTVADNVVAVLRGERPRPYEHRDLGLVVDLGGDNAVARPLGVNLSGLPAQAVARGYHLMALPTGVAKVRVVSNWLLHTMAGDDFVRTGFLARRRATLRDFEFTDAYLSPDQVRKYTRSQSGAG